MALLQKLNESTKCGQEVHMLYFSYIADNEVNKTKKYLANTKIMHYICTAIKHNINITLIRVDGTTKKQMKKQFKQYSTDSRLGFVVLLLRDIFQ